jgi:SAM-dependent methyltransferase
MPQMISARAMAKVLRTGNVRARLRATRDGQTAVRLQMVTAALETGVLDALVHGPLGTDEVAGRCDATDRALFEAFLRVLAGAGLIRGGDDAPWELTSAGRAVVRDDLVRASYEAFGGFHTDLYRHLRPVLTGGPARRDVIEQGEVIARISAAFEPFVEEILVRTVVDKDPRRVLDVGCGAGLQLATMLDAAPGATGVGVDTDADAAELATTTLQRRGLAGRATVLPVDIRAALDGAALPAPLTEPFDLALLANVVYYVPVAERVALFEGVARLLGPGGLLLVVTTAAAPQLFSRHFDLLLRAQEGQMELPDVDVLAGQLREAGLRPGEAQRIAPGTPLVALTAAKPT